MCRRRLPGPSGVGSSRPIAISTCYLAPRGYPCGSALLALAIALLVTLLGLLVAGDEALGLLLGLLLTSLVLFGLGIIGFYLDRLPGILHGKAGFPLIAHLRPKLKGEPSDD